MIDYRSRFRRDFTQMFVNKNIGLRVENKDFTKTQTGYTMVEDLYLCITDQNYDFL